MSRIEPHINEINFSPDFFKNLDGKASFEVTGYNVILTYAEIYPIKAFVCEGIL